MLDSRVTEHAVLGWLKLVESFDMKATLRQMQAEGRDGASSAAVFAYLKGNGLADIAAVCAAMLSPGVLVALEAGAVSAQMRGCRLNFRNGRVVSIVASTALGHTIIRRRGKTRKVSRRERHWDDVAAEA